MTRSSAITENLKSLHLLLSCFSAIGLSWTGIPLLVLSYRAGLTGFPIGQVSLPVLSFWPLFLLSLVLSQLLNYAFRRLAGTGRSTLGVVAILIVVLTAGCVAARKTGESRTQFFVGRDINLGETVAILFPDGYGGVVTRKVDLSSRRMLREVIQFPRSQYVPVTYPMSLQR